jgi:hypothetical protein
MNTMTLDRQTTLIQYGYGKQQMRNVLQLNNGNGTFSEIGCLAGVFHDRLELGAAHSGLR